MHGVTLAVTLAKPQVTRVQAAVRVAARRNMPDGERWQTVELRAEAEVSDPGLWREESRVLLLDLEQEVDRFLQPRQERGNSAKPHCNPIEGDNGGTTGNGRGNGNDVTAFWRTVYDAGLSRDAGLRLVAQAGGNFARARSLLAEG